MRIPEQRGSEFHVILQGLKLKPEVEKRIEGGIRKLILEEIAALDLKGDLTIAARNKFPAAIRRADGGATQGMLIKHKAVEK